MEKSRLHRRTEVLREGFHAYLDQPFPSDPTSEGDKGIERDILEMIDELDDFRFQLFSLIRRG